MYGTTGSHELPYKRKDDMARRDARIEVRATQAEKSHWEEAARAARISVGKLVRQAMTEYLSVRETPSEVRYPAQVIWPAGEAGGDTNGTSGVKTTVVSPQLETKTHRAFEDFCPHGRGRGPTTESSQACPICDRDRGEA